MRNKPYRQLSQDLMDEKRHYRMYKSGKSWAVAGASLLFAGMLMVQRQSVVQADDTDEMTVSAAATSTPAVAQATAMRTGTAATVAAQTITSATALDQLVMPVTLQDLTAPDWTAADFDYSQVQIDQPGTYPVTLSTQGLAALQAANPTVQLSAANVAAGTLTVQAATQADQGTTTAAPVATGTTSATTDETPAVQAQTVAQPSVTGQTPAATAQATPAPAPAPSTARASVTTSTDTIGYNSGANSLEITYAMQATAGDSFSITVPASTAVLGETEDVAVTKLAPQQGTTTVSPNADGSLTVTNVFTAGGSYQQTITVPMKGNGRAQVTPLDEVGTTTLSGTYALNGEQIGTYQITQVVAPQADLATPTRVNPSVATVAGILPDTTYVYEFDVNETTGVGNEANSALLVNSAVNYGTTVTIPVPTGFVLDQALTDKLNGFTDGTTIVQDGGAGHDLVITVPKGAGGQNFDNKRGYLIAGAYAVAQADTATPLTASGVATMVQQISDDPTDTLTFTTGAAWTDNLLPTGDAGAVNVEVALKGNSSAASSQLLLDGDLTNDPEALETFTVNYNAAAATSALTITITVPDGYNADRLAVPAADASTSAYLPQTMSYQYTLTLADGTTETGTVAAGGVITRTGTAAIRQAVLTPDLVDAGAASGKFTLYGHLSAAYDDGTAVELDDQLTTTVTLAGIDDQLHAFSHTQTVTAASARATAYVYHGDKSAGAAGGYVTMMGSGNYTLTTEEVFEPILYFVLPKDTGITSIQATLSSEHDGQPRVAGHPTITQFQADDGRTVVKVDYTGTGESINTRTTGAGASISLENLADALAGTSQFALYMTSPVTQIVAASYGTSVSQPNVTDLSLTGGDANAILLGTADWAITTVPGVYGASSAQADEPNPVTNAQSDKASTNPLTFYTSLTNNTGEVISGTVATVVNLPETGQNGSTFTFQMTGPVSLPAGITGTVYYATTQAVLAKDQTSFDTTGYVTADQVTDWTAIRSLYIQVDGLAANTTTGRLAIQGQTSVPEASLVGTIGYLQTGFFAPSLVVSTDDRAASIAITGHSTLNARFHYVDAAGADQYVDLTDLSRTLAEQVDPVFADYPTTQDALSAVDQTLIPAGYQLSGEPLKLVAGGTNQILADAATAGDLVMRGDFDGAYIQYELAPLTDVLTVTYVDVLTGETLQTDEVAGRLGETGTYTVEAVPQYELAAGQAGELTYTIATGNTDDLTVRLTHQLTRGTAETTRTITYKIAGGDQTKAPATEVQTLRWDTVTDEVTGTTVATAQGGYAAVDSPTLAGYTPDKDQVAAQWPAAVVGTPQNAAATVTYTAAPATLAIDYVDDVTGAVLKLETHTGVTDQTLSYTADLTDLADGYVLAKNQAETGAVILGPSTTSVTIHLTHQLTRGTAETTRTITYKIAGSDQTKAPAAEVQTLRWDTVTDEVTGTTVATAQGGYAAVASPTLAGYTPDKDQVAAQWPAAVVGTPQNAAATVTYTAAPATLAIDYVDDVTGAVLKLETHTGVTDQTLSYTADLTDLADGYVLAKNQAETGAVILGPSTTSVTIHLTHQLTRGTAETTRTITYKIAGGDQTKAPAAEVQTLRWDTVTDEVTGTTVATAQGGYAAVASPTLAGYTPDEAQVAAQWPAAVVGTPQNAAATVTYTPARASVTLNYVDQTDGRIVKFTTLPGVTDQTLTYTADLSDLAGYVLASGQVAGGTVTLSQATGIIEIKVTHQLTHATLETTRTITYKIDGPDQTLAPAAKQQTITWVTTTDEVTGATVATAHGVYGAVDSPSVPGYTPDRKQVAELVPAPSVTRPTDSEEVVTYKKNATGQVGDGDVQVKTQVPEGVSVTQEDYYNNLTPGGVDGGVQVKTQVPEGVSVTQEDYYNNLTPGGVDGGVQVKTQVPEGVSVAQEDYYNNLTPGGVDGGVQVKTQVPDGVSVTQEDYYNNLTPGEVDGGVQVKTQVPDGVSVTQEDYYNNLTPGEVDGGVQVKTQVPEGVSVTQEDYYNNLTPGEVDGGVQVKTQIPDGVSVTQEDYYNNLTPGEVDGGVQVKTQVPAGVSVTQEDYYNNLTPGEVDGGVQVKTQVPEGVSVTQVNDDAHRTPAHGAATRTTGDRQARQLPQTGEAHNLALTLSGLTVLGLLLGLDGFRKRRKADRS
ncbi:mucin-binding protein [Lacticaseibacillus absianus]|uniref:mucin-binding protein n=1 Tax=Lacticaseibacillus absianus TaxID=2729623 RepID=UPI0015CEC1E0|nr:MBG domain-containing protein [Lacticaseibacillus absianus]